MRGRAVLALAPLVFALLTADPALAAGPPAVEAAWVEDVTATSALLKAEVNPEGLASAYRFEYLTEAAYLANGEGFAGAALTPTGGAGSRTSPVTVFANLGGLTPSSAYYYRAVASNSAAPAGVAGPAHFLATEQPTNVFPPLDGRGHELVSPVDKAGGAVGAPESIFGGGDLQAAGSGAAFTFSSSSSFGAAAGAPPASQYLSTRGGAGWATRNVSAPLEAGGYGDHPDGVPFRVFSGDLSRALMSNGARCAVAGTCPPSYSLWEDGAFGLLPTLPGLRLAGASPDLHHAVFAAEDGLYEWSGAGLEALSEAPGALAAPIGAISENGSRVYWSQLEDGQIWLYEAGEPSKPLPETIGGAAAFQTASSDGAFAFYMVGGTLYRYSAAGESRETVASGVAGVLGASADGSVVYYQDSAGLQQWHSGTTTTIAPGPEVAAPGDYPPATGTARTSADGSHLAFLSATAIPPFDNTDADTGEPDTELYLYGPPPGGGAPRLLCASCNPTGERPSGPASIPGTVRNGTSLLYRPRVLSAGGNRVFFDSADKLVVPDTDARPDVYEWEAGGVGDCSRSPGCVGLVSGGRGEGGRFLDASESGSDAFFLSGESLVGIDPGSIDVYDDREGGGFPEPEAPFACKGDACQALPSPPEDPAPATLVPTSGNPPLKVEKLKGHPRRCPEGRRKVRDKKGKLRCVRRHRHHADGQRKRGQR